MEKFKDPRRYTTRLLSTGQVAYVLGREPRTITYRIENHTLPAKRIGKRYYVERDYLCELCGLAPPTYRGNVYEE